MKHTGKYNPITHEEILQVEESDITFWEKQWDMLTIEEKVMFLSFIKAPFLGKQNEEEIKNWYEYYQLKNIINL